MTFARRVGKPLRKGGPLLDLESELQGDTDEHEIRPRKRPLTSREEVPPDKAFKPKKEKEFAWMDSDDDESDGEKKKNSTGNTASNDTASAASSSKDVGRAARGGDDARSSRCSQKDDKKKDVRDSARRGTHSRNGSNASPDRSRSRSSSREPPPPAELGEISTFSQMARQCDNLKKKSSLMTPADCVECFAVAARVKFYDGELMQECLIPRVQRHLGGARSKSPFATEGLVSILMSLADLNAFHKGIFDRIVRELADKRYNELNGQERINILSAFKATKYDCKEDKEFYEWLSSTAKAERYEAACIQQRMIRGNSKSADGMHAPEGYLRTFIIGTTSGGVEVRRPPGLNS